MNSFISIFLSLCPAAVVASLSPLLTYGLPGGALPIHQNLRGLFKVDNIIRLNRV
jgi:hypothetical protein